MVLNNDNADTRRIVEHCFRKHKTTVNPIIDWEDSDVWEFIREENIPYCGLYDEGLHRIGCIGCPLARQKRRERDFLRWPKYKKMYLRALDKMIEERVKKGKPAWRCGGEDREGITAMDVFNWWMEYEDIPGQIDLLEEYDDD